MKSNTYSDTKNDELSAVISEVRGLTVLSLRKALINV